MQNRKQMILETVANLLMELSPETYKSATEKSLQRGVAYDTIAKSGEREIGQNYNFPMHDVVGPLTLSKEPRDKGIIDRKTGKPVVPRVRGVTDTITSDPAPQGRLVTARGTVRTGVGNPEQRAASEVRRGARFFSRAARGYAARGEEMPNLDI